MQYFIDHMQSIIDALENASCTNLTGASLDTNKKSKAETSSAIVEFESHSPSEMAKDEEIVAQSVKVEDVSQNNEEEKESAQAQHVINQSKELKRE